MVIPDTHASGSSTSKHIVDIPATPLRIPTKIVHVNGATTPEITFLTIHPQTGELVKIRRDQLWFWSTDWQAGERQVDQEIANGDYEEFDTIEEFISSL